MPNERDTRVMIDVGSVLDKYELRERVGQGGMAIVYRGFDRTLRREVAVKVLHRHLADHAEARSRFEREAQAVAKLRHENILEIFAYSGRDSDQSYIVTEFIEGQTLKQFVTDHEIKFPEIGAMICGQLCRALAHAHSLGILHRDVKPENVMIRSDGVVKLTDFGISQMLDMQRMTVTGQLLGSPAYMSPEHVEGQPLDFRTDVFAVGIVLYQLVIGKLPFEGKNPHEILKRIAECRYLDPRQANPAVGNELGRIIVKAMAREKDDRYGDVTGMLLAIDRYLEGSGLTNHKEELGRFFKSPVAYEMALHQRLTDHLARRGRELLGENRAAALELFNRVLVLDPSNAAVHSEIDRMSRRRRGVQLGAGLAAVLVLAGAAVGLRAWLSGGPDRGRHGAIAGLGADDAGGAAASAAGLASGPGPSASGAADGIAAAGAPRATGASSGQPDAGAAASAGQAAGDRTGSGGSAEPNGHGGSRDPDRNGHAAEHHDDAGAAAIADSPDAAPAAARSFHLMVYPQNSEVSVAGAAWQTFSGGAADLPIADAEVPIRIRNAACCEEEARTVRPDEAGQSVSISLGFLPARLIPRCPEPGAQVAIDDKPARLDANYSIPIPSLGTATVYVEFVANQKIDKQRIKVKYNDEQEVTCKFE